MKFCETTADSFRPLNPDVDQRDDNVAQDNDLTIYQNIFDLICHNLILDRRTVFGEALDQLNLLENQ